MTAAETALTRFDQGYSCAQAVFSALAEPRGLERDMAFRIAAGFGGGLARSGQTCGAITGAIMALGLAQASVSLEENRTEKEKTYLRVQRFMREFAARHGSTVCLDLLGCDISTPQGLAHARQNGLFQSRCTKLVRDAAELAGAILGERA
jgi:C_GCAxxG_C_C family probable redox protein